MTKNPANSAFQSYPVATDSLVSPIPDSMTFEEAVVLPLAISTACAGLYTKDLSLPLPLAKKPAKIGKTILVWGGASSVGATAIQLAVASGVTVISTASPANHKFVESLGADVVFNYKSPTVVEDIASALEKTDFVGVYDAIGEDSSFDAVSAILDRLNKKVPVTSVLPSSKSTERFIPTYGEELPDFQRLHMEDVADSIAQSLLSLLSRSPTSILVNGSGRVSFPRPWRTAPSRPSPIPPSLVTV
jgi:D-arabinose 1-dehydrogenase-like Zn-dependent alcohol dehydrogenase